MPSGRARPRAGRLRFSTIGAETELVELPERGRRFRGSWRVRLGDLGGDGRILLASVVGALQDVATDDAEDAGLDRLPGAWVARRTYVRLGAPVSLHDRLDLVTFCSGIGRSGAERRTRVTSPRGVVADAATLWVYVDAASGRPLALGPEFTERFGESAGGRRIDSRLRHTRPPAEAATRAWPLRAGDLDILAHVNNARAVEALDDELERQAIGPARWLSVEYRSPLGAGDHVVLASTREPVGQEPGGADELEERLRLWWLVDAEVRVSAAVGLGCRDPGDDAAPDRAPPP